MALPRGLRNRNPGNLEPGGWQGEIGNDGRFAIFDEMENGIRAICKQLIVYQQKYGIYTVRGAISRWAPSNENDTEAYIAGVCAVLECKPDDRFDFTNGDFLFWMATAIGEHNHTPDTPPWHAEQIVLTPLAHAIYTVIVLQKPFDVQAFGLGMGGLLAGLGIYIIGDGKGKESQATASATAAPAAQ